MKRSYLIIGLIYVLGPYIALSQDKLISTQAKIDSLEIILDNLGDNEEKVGVLNEYARYCFYNRNVTKAFLAVRDANRLALQLDYEEGKILYFHSLSVFYMGRGMATYYQKKVDWISERTDEEPPTYERYLSPDIEIILTKELLDELNTLLPQFNGDEDKELRANILSFIGITNYNLSNLDEALSNYLKAIKLFQEIEELYPVILLSRYQISILNFQNKEEEANEIEHFLVDLVAKSKDHNRLYFITSAMGDVYTSEGRYALAIEYYRKSLEEAERVGDKDLVANIQLDLGTAYESLELNNKAVELYKKGLSTIEELGDTLLWKYANGVIVFPLIALGEYEEAKIHMKLSANDSLSYSLNSNLKNFQVARQLDAQGQLLMHQGQYAESIPYFLRANEVFVELQGFEWALPFMKLYLAECYFKIGNYQTAINYGLECLALTDHSRVTAKASLLLSDIYADINNLPLAYKYSKMHIDISTEAEQLDKLNRIADAEIRTIIDKSQSQIADLEKENIRNEEESKVQKIWILSIAGALMSAIVLALLLYRNNKNKQRANTVLTEQKRKIETTLEKLESTQTQLIQSEKMASLGELTAGIAHEIQNPLNFVNNFSEVSTEIVGELNEELDKGEIEEAKSISNDLIENLEKINHHGERASDIVKNMLEHSRQGDGTKELVDINKLADEYLRLAYHGIRAHDKSFNADFKLALDEGLPKINVVPQDMGRVLLNLINNAFHACAEQRKRASADRSVSTYQPLVTVSTKWNGNNVEIMVSDNGLGIPDDIKDKIFQPFFTTKATGEGTGLGLSLSYDIITKGHAGELRIESSEKTGASFTIVLPIQAKS